MERIGYFTQYTKTEFEEGTPDPVKQAIYIKDEQGRDWYELVKTLPVATYVGVGNNGTMVATASNDPSMIFPKDLTLYRLEDMIEDPLPLLGRIVEGETLTERSVFDVVHRYSKASLLDSMTDEEFDSFDATLLSASSRKRSQWAATTEWQEDQTIHTDVKGWLSASFSAARAGALLSAARLS